MYSCVRSKTLRGCGAFLIVAALLSSHAVPAAGAPSFQGLGDLAGDDFYSYGYGMSGDGSVVVGMSHGSNGHEAFRWDGTMTGIGDFPGGIFSSRAQGASTDGSVVTGFGDTATGGMAFLWDTISQTLTPLGSLIAGGGSSGYDVSSDGLAVAGISDSATGLQAFRWQGTMVALGDVAGGDIFSRGFAISGDGLTVVGDSESANGLEAFIWQGVMTGLGDLPGGGFESQAFGVNSDGSMVVGRSVSAFGNEAFLWRPGVPIRPLGDLPGGIFGSVAFDVTDKGVVVGSSSTAGFSQAFLWKANTGMLRLQDVLEAHGLADELVGWNLTQARAISDDGKTFSGWGFNPDGETEAWIATIPEPGSGLLLCLGLALLPRRPGKRGACPSPASTT